VTRPTSVIFDHKHDLPFGKEFRLAEAASGRTRATGVIPLELAKTHAHLVHNRLTSTGVA